MLLGSWDVPEASKSFRGACGLYKPFLYKCSESFFFASENVFERFLHGVEHVLWTRLWVLLGEVWEA